ncbi:hypothetical protein [Parvibaculum sp.]|uniref:hypothetical protein n=1 Tax=Parvibaculum sp. TaxID=2024848 RepID=UPI0026204131|nr:hypothetical protein [Parvibaculum sp.]MCW5727211.1 hypothetical protein [Parvibaculum sp.]
MSGGPSRAETIDALLQEFARYADARLVAELGARLPIAFFVFDGNEAHAVSSGDWHAVRAALADWAEDPRDPATTFSLEPN